MLDLYSTIETLDRICVPEKQGLFLPDEFCSPGFWVLIAALGKLHNYSAESINFASDAQESYASAICLHACLSGKDNYNHNRINKGRNYSPLVQLDSQEVTDGATEQINNCLRHVAGIRSSANGLSKLFAIVGELHDNVWSHGMCTGFSMAQKSKVPNEDDFYIEFALADIGLGLTAEMRRVGMDVRSDQEAIEWCIQGGNSTKLRHQRDEWAQRVPGDIAGGSPFGAGVKTFRNENNHQGLGLFKLVEFVKEYSGELCLGTGNSLLKIDCNAYTDYIRLSNEWSGVAISCRFRTSSLSKAVNTEQVDPAVMKIMDQLRG